ncbi:MAG TPA: hypothetical protein VFB42_13725 [Gaiellaceae bacterium]|nr:hypothetical protein [Gaiellaceae bacterium]
MEAHVHFLDRLREHVPHVHLVHRETSSARLATTGIAAGVGGGIALAAPLVVYDWAKAGHTALELPAAVTAWLFGLEHFAQNGYRWWPIVIGALFLLAYWAVLGTAFAGLADRVYRVRTLAASLTLGAVWSFVSFMFFWYMLLPIARDGAPFRQTAVAAGELVAPNWVWILGFALSGLVTGACYRALRAAPAAQSTPAATATARAA